MNKKMTAVSAALAALVFASSASDAASVRQELVGSSTIETVLKRGVLRAGLSTFVPSGMRSKKGELIGFEVDIASRVAKDMGVKIEFVPTPFAGIIPALLTGKFDLIMTGMELKSSRNLKVNFSIPYRWGKQGMLANKKLTGDFKSFADFNKPEVKFAVRRGAATPAEIVRTRFPKAELLRFDDDQEAVQDVMNGNAHAFVSSEPKISYYVVDNPEVLHKPFGEQGLRRWPGAFAMRKGDVDTLNWLNNWIMLNTENGFIKERFDYWFSVDRPWRHLVQGK
ncbi:MAG: transporter substrate-binding domain-containing protein [Rhodospirillales bacterium]|nr:transporter substrate-binding domain-containing protein [Rhodospirillales bacterium]